MNPALHPLAPKFWRHEPSGVLAPAIERYLNNVLLTVRDVSLIRAYFEQWVNSPVWDQNPYYTRESIAELHQASQGGRRDREPSGYRAVGQGSFGYRNGSALSLSE